MERELVSLVKKNRGVVELTLRRPDKRNALNVEMLRQLRMLVRELNSQRELRVLLLKAEGPAFCAGADLNEVLDEQIVEESAHLLVDVFSAVCELDIVTLAAVQGEAWAGGAAFMLCCDTVIAADNMTVSFPEIQRGLVPAFVYALLKRKVNGAQLSQLLLFGQKLSALEAQRLGLVLKVVAREALYEEADAVISDLLKGAPGAQRATKRLLRSGHTCMQEELKQMLKVHVEARNSNEAHEGLAAFIERRQPHFG